MPTITTSVGEQKVNAWKLRQEDTGWGRAVAHIFLPYGIYYALSRRTLTPFSYWLGGTFLVGFCFGLLIGPGNIEEERKETMASALAIIATPVLAKIGIDSARDEVKKKLAEINHDKKVSVSAILH